MALLEDPTIQRILDEVNKAASGGVFGLAGNYIPEPSKPMPHMSGSKMEFFNQQHQQAPIFYPTPDMFNLNGLPSFDSNLDMNSMESIMPISTPNNFELYNSGLYDSMARSILSPYENYKNGHLNTNNNNTNTGIRSMSSVSSLNNEILLEHHRHQEYPTIPPKITAAVPNLGLNLRTTPPLESMPVNASEVGDEVVPNETTDTATMDLMADKDDNLSIPPNNNEEMESPHICKWKHASRLASVALIDLCAFSFGWPHFLRSKSTDHSTQRFKFCHL